MAFACAAEPGDISIGELIVLPQHCLESTRVAPPLTVPNGTPRLHPTGIPS
jgi:hypothetical protein